MKKFSLTHKLLAVALAFVLVAVSLPDYLSFAQQPAQEQSETDEFEDNAYARNYTDIPYTSATEA